MYISLLIGEKKKWTWAATILQSSNVAWEYGVSGPFWYASGATIQACVIQPPRLSYLLFLFLKRYLYNI